jgi:membrane protease YdiL (CAAX protease family)
MKEFEDKSCQEAPIDDKRSNIALRFIVWRIATSLGMVLFVIFTMIATEFLLSRQWPSIARSDALEIFLNQTSMLLVSLLMIAVLMRGDFRGCGFTFGTYRFKATILLWFLLGTFGSLSAELLGGNGIKPTGNLTHLQIIMLAWIYASTVEEIVYRGLILSFLSPLSPLRITIGKIYLSLPVLICGLFFGAMHLLLLTAGVPIGALCIFIPFGIIGGCVAGYYKETTGSIIPAVIVHSLFNIGGNLPFWIYGGLWK